MMWAIIIILAYLPIFYRLHNRLRKLEDEVMHLKQLKSNDMK